MLDIDRERDPDTLRLACRAYETANRQLIETVQRLTKEVAELQGLDASQITLELPQVDMHEDEKPSEAVENQASRRPTVPATDPPRGHGPTQQALPIQPLEHRFDRLPDCDVCGRTMGEMKGQFEESEEITVAEARYSISIHRRQKYRCSCNSKVLTAPGPPKLIPGGRYSLEFAVHVAIAKYCDHLPLERQVRQMSRDALEVTSQTLWDQICALAEHLEPTWEALGRRILEEPVLHVDETGWRMMGAKAPRWTVWGLCAPEIAWYRFAHTKSTTMAERILGTYRGTLVVDGFAVYPKLQRDCDGQMAIAHCWAHVDRKFKDATDPAGSIAEIRSLIAELYAIEREIEGPFPGDGAAQARRLERRQARAGPVVAEIYRWATSLHGQRRSSFGKAVRYLLKHWAGLKLFLEDPRIPLDNNPAERVLRGVVVGRKNYYGNRSKRGAKVAAIFYSLIETAKLRGVEPRAYLQDAGREAIEHPGRVSYPS